MSVPFLFEVGVEEIPDWMIQNAISELRKLFEVLLQGNRLASAGVSVDATPRRLLLRAYGLPACQSDTEERVLGPSKAAAFKDGTPTAAALGFAKKLGVTVADLGTESTPRGEYICYDKKLAGRQTRQILAETLPDLILKISFPKTMYWTGKGGPRFIRPIRWIVALLGDEVVPFELAGVKSGNLTCGHRRLGRKQVEVTIASYDARLRENFVIVQAAERKKKIEAGIEALLGASNMSLRPDPELLNTLVYMTEYPAPILGRFDSEFLRLPQEVLVTVMRHHQKYFSVEDSQAEIGRAHV